LPEAPVALALTAADGNRRTLTLAPGDGGAAFFAEEIRSGRRGRVRSSLEDARIVEFRQWYDDRILIIDVAGQGGPGGARRVVAEFFGRAGGVFVLEGDAVAECLAGRKLPVGEPYPWPGDRGRKAAADAAAEGPGPYLVEEGAAALSRGVAYMSPLVARWIVAGGTEEHAAERFGAFARVAAGETAPAAVLVDGTWRPYAGPLFDADAAEVRRFDGVNEAVAYAYAENETASRFDDERRAAERRLATRVKRLERQRRELERRRDEYGQYEDYRRMGEALKYNLASLRRGMPSVTLPDPYGGGDLEIELQADLSPAENMERLFKKYRRAKRGVEAVAERLAALDGELAEARAELAELREATSLEELEPWREDDGPAAKSAGKVQSGPGRRFLSSDGLLVIVGRSAAENDEITFKVARPHDLWLHAEQARGSHVVIRRDDKNKPVPRRTVEEAAALAAFYSGDKHSGLVPVIVVERRHVRRAKGPAGRVLPRGGEVVFVEPGVKLKPAAGRGS
jgi:predicted ribosome quality control (RQC) complex YloA/Tae2 family protein